MFVNERSLPGQDIQAPPSSPVSRAFSPNRAQTRREGLAKQLRAVPTTLSRDRRLRRAVLLSFRDPLAIRSLELQEVTKREWRDLMHWLDVSGLALYFLDRLDDLQLAHVLPADIYDRLQQSMRDNKGRTHGMIAESVAIQEEFQAASVSYAVIKGFSLWPESVPRLELRHQFDLDFLIAEGSVLAAQRVLKRQGYRLYAVSGGSWEFKKEEKIGISMEDFYKDTAGRTVELHLQRRTAGTASVLDCARERNFYGIDMPVLSPVDLFLGQGMHAYKHICGEFSRAAHLLEFYRHVLTRQQDSVFWSELRSRGEESPKVSLGLGIVTLLITSVLGEFAPRALTEWTVDRLPPAAHLWVRLHGHHVLFGDVPGTKLYLLLQRELESFGHPESRSLWKTLLPRRLPPVVVLASHSETLGIRARRYRMHLKYVLLRLRFHLVEGLRYGWEAYRWRRHMEGLTR